MRKLVLKNSVLHLVYSLGIATHISFYNIESYHDILRTVHWISVSDPGIS